MLMQIETDGTPSGFPMFAPDEISDVMQISGYFAITCIISEWAI